MTPSEREKIRAVLENTRSANFDALFMMLKTMKESSYNISGGRRYFEDIKQYIDESINKLDSALHCLDKSIT